ncbi:MAG: putative sugar O-methyltransferase [Elusimicrobia bacterium]|nr:putative sugar O-methyltransferase [Elusimicrobiota bacterium]
MKQAKPPGTSKSWQDLGAMHRSILSQEGSWDNFRRTIASRYFTDPDYSEEDIRFAYDFLKARGVRINETDFAEGNPVRVEVDGKIITQDLLTSSSELYSMESVIDLKEVKTVVEIGGGYGRMALLILQRYPHIKYTIVDVSPAVEVSEKFLTGKFNAEFLSPEELDFKEEADLFYSSSVMSELGFRIVNHYFRLINQKGRFFYLKDWKKGHHLNDLPAITGFGLRVANKISKLIFRRPWTAAFDAYRIREDNYPQFGWKELLHQDCENITAYSPSHKKTREDKFFEIVYRIK